MGNEQTAFRANLILHSVTEISLMMMMMSTMTIMIMMMMMMMKMIMMMMIIVMIMLIDNNNDDDDETDDKLSGCSLQFAPPPNFVRPILGSCLLSQLD